MAMEPELAKHLFKKPITLKYPFEKVPPPEGFRGKLSWDADKCVGCGLCVTVCPAFALEMVGKGSTAEFKYHVARCLFCSQCVSTCPKNALKMTNEYELADYKPIVVEFKREKVKKL